MRSSGSRREQWAGIGLQAGRPIEATPTMCLHGWHGGGQRGSVDSAQRWGYVPDEPSGTRGTQTPGPCGGMQRSDLHHARGVRPDRSSGSSSRAAERKSTTGAARVPIGTLRSSTHRRFEPPRGNSRPLSSRMDRVRRRLKRRVKSCQPDRCLALSEAHWSRRDAPCISIASLGLLLVPPRRGPVVSPIAFGQSADMRRLSL